MKKIISFVLLVISIGLAYYGYTLYQDLPLDYKNLSITLKPELPEAFNTSSTLIQFSQGMRFSKNKLSYFFESDCNLERKNTMKEAFNMISEGTEIIYFYELENTNEEPDIIISCSEETKQREDSSEELKTFIAGEGGPRKYLDLNPYPLIIQGEIQIYSNRYATHCEEPLVELHELLHVFGFNHIDKKESILYPYLSCNQKLDEEIIDALIELYSVPSKPELSIRNISASKAGKYLDFNIEIYNSGLINTTNIILEVISEEKSIKEFDVKTISPGVITTLNIKNLDLKSSKINSIIFRIKASEEEYFLENNLVEMSV